jgi:hypothetical protein
MRRICFFLIFLSVSFTAKAQTYSLSGNVSDNSGKPIPFGTIYLQSTSNATSANERGFYCLNVEKGQHNIVFKFIGYEPKVVPIDVRQDSVFNVSLTPELYRLNDVVINSPAVSADEIIRKVIRSKATRKDLVKNYAADVYMKGVQKIADAPKKFLGEDVSKVLSLDSNRKGILYLSESQSKLYYKAPDNYREVMLASKVSGKNESLSFNNATDLIADFNKNILQFDELSVKGFISPLADFAFQYYSYKLLGQYIENGRLIDKIEVIPRHNFGPVFSGELYIVENSWQVHSLNLVLNKRANINFADTVRFRQQYIPVAENVWMPASLQLTFRGKVLGFHFEGYFLSIYSNYAVNGSLPDNFFSGEILRVVDDVKRDRTYWLRNRPVPLTDEEKEDYNLKDSVEAAHNTREYKDSVDEENNRVTPLKLAAFGVTHVSTVHKTTYTFAPILPGIFYNTVEGFGYQYQMTFKKEYGLKNFIDVTPKIRYGLANNHFNPSIEARYFYDPINKGFLSFKAGSEVLEITNLRSSVSLANSINTLIYETNNRKFYERTVVSLGGSYEAATGLFGTATLEYGQRRPMLNASTYSIVDRKSKQFSSNNPFFPDLDVPLFEKHEAVTFQAELDYAPAARYISRPEGKFYEPFKYPRLMLTYRKGFNKVLGSDADFDFTSVEIYQNDLKLGLFGKSSYTFKLGKFFNNDRVYYPDFYHFRGNNSLIFEGSLRNFHWLDLYGNSTSKQFFEAHYEHNLGGYLVNKLPLIRRLKLEEIMGGAYLDQPANKNYYEVFFGLQRLVVRVDYALAFSNDIKIFNGFKFTYRLK